MESLDHSLDECHIQYCAHRDSDGPMSDESKDALHVILHAVYNSMAATDREVADDEP